MKRVKLLAIIFFILPLIALAIFNTKPVGTIAKAADAAETYKAKCAMCHGPTAQKLFDPAKTDEVLLEIIMKGKKGEKPPFYARVRGEGNDAGRSEGFDNVYEGIEKAE